MQVSQKILELTNFIDLLKSIHVNLTYNSGTDRRSFFWFPKTRHSELHLAYCVCSVIFQNVFTSKFLFSREITLNFGKRARRTSILLYFGGKMPSLCQFFLIISKLLWEKTILIFSKVWWQNFSPSFYHSKNQS